MSAVVDFQASVNRLETALDQLRQSRTAVGDCDLCGHWDTQLIDGIGLCCRKKHRLDDVLPSRLPAGQAELKFPCNEHHFQQLLHAASVVILLDEMGIGVVQVYSGQRCPIIESLQPLPPGVGKARHTLVRAGRGGLLEPLQVWATAIVEGCMVEWKVRC